MKYEDFKKQAEKIGKGNRCITKKEGKEISDARLQKEHDSWYICQNEWIGSECKDRLGYKFSWVVIEEYTAKEIEYLKPFKDEVEAPETITIAGHTYIKSEVESRLKDLKEVE